MASMDLVELYYDKSDNSYLIKSGEATLKLSEQQFLEMRQDGRSPLLKKLWNSAKKERGEK